MDLYGRYFSWQRLDGATIPAAPPAKKLRFSSSKFASKQIVSCVGLYFGMVYNIHIKIGLRSIGIVKQSSREVTFLLSSSVLNFHGKFS
jgi:hypothetical protein